MQQILSNAPSRWDSRSTATPVALSLPLPEDGSAVFDVWRSEQMEAGLAGNFPNIRTYFGQDRENLRRNIYILITSGYVKILYFDQRGMYSRLERANDALPAYHFSYRSNWGRSPDLFKACRAEIDENDQRFQDMNNGEARRGETKLYRYRLALATTGEYGSYHGSTKEAVLEAMNELLLQVNAIFERESSVHFDLVSGNDLLIFLDPDNDPFDNTDVDQMLEANKMICNYAIGYTKFDVGHVLSTKFGGQAHIGSICNFSRKAKAFTGLEQPEGYYMGAIFAHELGHQIGARHTQSNDCNRDLPTSFEPGSGSTIMGYAGICEPNVQDLPDDYFHGNSLELIAEKTALGLIFGCVPGTATDNRPPQVEAGPDLYVPIGTPFHLKGVGADPDGDSLLYQWEQMDAMTLEDTLNLDGPIFRSLAPTALPERIFGTSGNNWEQLPTHARTARFRLTAKDLHKGLGSSVFDEMTVHFIDLGEPFRVLSPNQAGISWETGSMQTISWEVAGTDQEPILCQTVDIYLSSDGGQHYDIRLATEIPNDGSALVNIPVVAGEQFRLKVSCSNGAFFATADQLLEIFDPNAPVPVDTMMTDTTIIMPPDTLEMDTTVINPPPDTMEHPVQDTMMQDTVSNPVQDTIDIPLDTIVLDTIMTPLPDTLDQPVMDTISGPPVDTTVTMPADTLSGPPMDTFPTPPDDTLVTPPLDTISSPPMDTLSNPPGDTLPDLPMDTLTTPPNDSLDDMPTMPQDTFSPSEPDSLMTRPDENPTDTIADPGEDPPILMPPGGEDTCEDCPPTVTLAPNPTSGFIHYRFEIGEEMNGDLEIVNGQGQILHRRPLSLPPGRNDLQLDLSPYPGGMYWIRLVSKDYVVVKAVVLR